jgi:hypothetical protein
MTLNHLSDDELVASLHDLCVEVRRLDARVVAHLVEVEERRLHLKAACSSLFDFCVRRLGMSEGAAFRRITAARLVRRHPSLLGHIERGAVHLSTLVLLRDHFAASNVEELVAATSGKTKREVEELLARRAPRPDVPATLRRLPTPAVPASDGTPFERGPSPSDGTLFERGPSPSASPRSAGRIEPLAEARHKLQLTIGTELREKLERATALLRHRNPSGDLATVLDHALDALLAKVEKERLGKTSRPRRTTGAARATRPGRVTAAVRREVFARDGEQCTYVDAAGSRCASCAFLELDHVESRALGGADDAANLLVTCRAHNRLHAEEVFGRRCVERGIHFRQQRSASTPPLAGSCASDFVNERRAAR